MRSVVSIALLALAACSSSTDPGTPDPIDYRVSVSSSGGDVVAGNYEVPVVAVVRLPSGEFARDVTVKWEASVGTYATQTLTGPDSASTVVWRFPYPNPTNATIRACATEPVDRPCTYYSGVIVIAAD